jgi:hypothetical protein
VGGPVGVESHLEEKQRSEGENDGEESGSEMWSSSRASSSSDEATSASEDEKDGEARPRGERDPGEAGPRSEEPQEGVYQRRDPAGAPFPLAPHMLTLSLLPRTHWQSLLHLDAIKVLPAVHGHSAVQPAVMCL